MKNPFETSKEEKVQIKPENHTPVQAVKEVKEPTQRTMILSEESAYLQEVISGQPKTLEEVEVRERKNFEGYHRLSLPPEVEKYTAKYTFRWINAKKRAISEATQIKGWVLLNRTYFPDLPNHLFTSNGIIERGDNILAFIPKKIADKMLETSREMSSDLVKSRLGAHKGNPNFYVPSDASEEGEEARVVGL